MSNKCKVGLDYFPFDASFFEDDKIQLIHAEYGPKGVLVAIKLLCKIYKEGYYYKWGDDQCLLFSKNAGSEFVPSFVFEVVNGLIRRSFFDKRVFDSFGILTSSGIQKRYFDATGRYKKLTIISEYLLIKPPSRENVHIIKINVDVNAENVYANPHNGNGSNNGNKSDNGSETPTPSTPPFYGNRQNEANQPPAENFGDISPSEMMIPGSIENCHRLYTESEHFKPAREMLAMKGHMDESILVDWVGVFAAQLTSRGDLKKTLKDFASHFSNWLPKQDFTKTPKQYLENEQRNNSNQKGSKPGRGSAESFYRAIAGSNSK